MSSMLTHSLHGAGVAALLCSQAVHGQQPSAPDLQAQLRELQRQLAEQRVLIDTMARQLESNAAMTSAPALTDDALERARGTGNGAASDRPGQGSEAAGSDQDRARVAEESSARPVRQGAASAAQTSPAPSQSGSTVTSPLPTPAAHASGAGTAAADLLPNPARPTSQAGYKLSPVQTPSPAPLKRPAAPAAPGPGSVVAKAMPGADGGPAAATPSQAAVAQSNSSGPVGKPPASRGRPPDIAPLFEQPGVLTPAGKFVFEPSVQFGYSSSNRVALVGYTVIPALLIGLIDVREIRRNTTTATFSARTGLSNRLEVDVKLPYVYRSDATVSREIFTGTAVENVFDTKGRGVGDAEIGMRYQLNNGGPDSPFYVGSLRFKSRTGRDPFKVITDCTQRCVGPNATGTGLPLDLPTGSGFYSIQPGLTWLFPSDPAVFFASASYLHNLKRSNVSRTVLSGEQEFLGEIKPGDIAGFNFGMGLGLNEKASFSLGYDHSSIGRTRQNGVLVPGAVRTQLGTLLLGFSYRISDKRSLNVSVGTGVTRDTPDVTLTVRLPTTF